MKNKSRVKFIIPVFFLTFLFLLSQRPSGAEIGELVPLAVRTDFERSYGMSWDEGSDEDKRDLIKEYKKQKRKDAIKERKKRLNERKKKRLKERQKRKAQLDKRKRELKKQKQIDKKKKKNKKRQSKLKKNMNKMFNR